MSASKRGYLPRTDSAILQFANQFHSVLVLDPLVYGVSGDDCTTLNGYILDFRNKLSLVDPVIRNKTSVVSKNDSRTILVNFIRQLARTVYGKAGLSDAQITELGLTVRKQATPSPVPATKPLVGIVAVSGSIATITLRDVTSQDKRGRPARVAGANVFKFVGENPPENFNQWEFAGPVNKTRFEIDLGATLAPATKVWITACWVNPKSQTGPLSDPIFAYTQAGGTMYKYGVMKMAA